MTTTRTGTLGTVDATRTHHSDTSVRELVDGTIEYYVGDSARARDGYATLPGDLVSQVRWDVTDEQIRAERQRAANAGEHDLADLCEVALGQHDDTGGLTDPATGLKIAKADARARVGALLDRA